MFRKLLCRIGFHCGHNDGQTYVKVKRSGCSKIVERKGYKQLCCHCGARWVENIYGERITTVS